MTILKAVIGENDHSDPLGSCSWLVSSCGKPPNTRGWIGELPGVLRSGPYPFKDLSPHPTPHPLESPDVSRLPADETVPSRRSRSEGQIHFLAGPTRTLN